MKTDLSIELRVRMTGTAGARKPVFEPYLKGALPKGLSAPFSGILEVVELDQVNEAGSEVSSGRDSLGSLAVKVVNENGRLFLEPEKEGIFFRSTIPWKGPDEPELTLLKTAEPADDETGKIIEKNLGVQLQLGEKHLYNIPLYREASETFLDEGGRIELSFILHEGKSLPSQRSWGSKTYSIPLPSYWHLRPAKGGAERAGAPNNFVKLYQDADASLDGSCCFEDIGEAIRKARHFVYIIGWSLWPELDLVRGDDGYSRMLLRKLLINKANDHVDVRLLVWDDTNVMGHGLETLDDDTVRAFAKTNVKVVTATVDRTLKAVKPDLESIASKSYWGTQWIAHGLLKKATAIFLEKVKPFSHHQKTVICDSGEEGERISPIAFVGGLDLAQGRWDRPSHPLFGCQVMNSDQCQNSIPGTVQTCNENAIISSKWTGDWYHGESSGDQLSPNVTRFVNFDWPREPWHDVHAFVEGPAAIDVLRNFHRRWEVDGRRMLTKLENAIDESEKEELTANLEAVRTGLVDSDTGELLPALGPSDVMSRSRPGSAIYKKYKGLELADCDWKVQTVRSIAETEDPKGSFKAGTERGVQLAYLKAIYQAERFIYIETQYFMGGSEEWIGLEKPNGDEQVDPEGLGAAAPNQVPLALVERIERAIKKDQIFRVYVVLPLYPEGDPTSLPNLEQRRFQWKTMEMMYAKIGAALDVQRKKSTNSPAHNRKPTDFLGFYCLGQTAPGHALPKDMSRELVWSQEEYRARLFQKSHRHMIYVHSKMMITDDSHILIGTANLNERSLNGGRDTEICLSAYQANRSKLSGPGESFLVSPELARFRRNLWVEHLERNREQPKDLDYWQDPHAKVTKDKVDDYAQKNWKAYLAGEQLSHGHLMPYPVGVDVNGEIDVVEGGLIPDGGGLSSCFQGSDSMVLPNEIIA